MTMTEAELRTLLATLRNTRDDEIGCDTAFQFFPLLADEQLAGKPASEHTRLLVQHLVRMRLRRERNRSLILRKIKLDFASA